MKLAFFMILLTLSTMSFAEIIVPKKYNAGALAELQTMLIVKDLTCSTSSEPDKTFMASTLSLESTFKNAEISYETSGDFTLRGFALHAKNKNQDISFVYMLVDPRFDSPIKLISYSAKKGDKLMTQDFSCKFIVQKDPPKIIVPKMVLKRGPLFNYYGSEYPTE